MALIMGQVELALTEIRIKMASTEMSQVELALTEIRIKMASTEMSQFELAWTESKDEDGSNRNTMSQVGLAGDIRSSDVAGKETLSALLPPTSIPSPR